MVETTKQLEFDCVAGIETKGIIFASALAAQIGKPLMIFRKMNRIIHTPEKLSHHFKNWKHENEGIEIEKTSLSSGREILVVDDVAMTLSSFRAAVQLLANTESRISAFLCVANLSAERAVDGISIMSLINAKKEFS